MAKYAGADLSSDKNKAILRDLTLKLTGRILVFDDLERSAMPVSDVMGFINAYVEHDGLKVIVIANEDDIHADERKEYFCKKEKLIGKTILVSVDAEPVLNSFVDKLTDTYVVETVRQEKEVLLSTFTSSGKRNFRSLRSILSDFERLVSSLDDRLRKTPEAMVQLLLYVTATGLEYRSGDLNSERLANIMRIHESMMISSITNEKKTDDIQELERLRDTYPDVNWSDPIVPPAALAALFVTGSIDVATINSFIGNHPLIAGYEQTPPWRRLWNWAELTREQYFATRGELIEQLHRQELTNPGVILHAAGIVLSLKSHGDHLLGEQTNIATFFIDYAQSLLMEQKLEPIRELFSTMDESYAGLGYGERNSEEFQEIYEAIRSATLLAFAKHMENIASQYIERIASTADAYSALHEYGYENGNYGDAPFLQYIDPSAFARLMIVDSVPNRRLFASLYSRYEHDGFQQALLDEHEWTRALRQKLEQIAALASPPHKLLQERAIQYYMDKIAHAIEVARKVSHDTMLQRSGQQ